MAVCDICNEPGTGTLVSAGTFRAAINNGFCPYRLELDDDMGAPSIREEWRREALKQSTGWNLCARCEAALRPFLDSGAATSGSVTAGSGSAGPTPRERLELLLKELLELPDPPGASPSAADVGQLGREIATLAEVAWEGTDPERVRRDLHKQGERLIEFTRTCVPGSPHVGLLRAMHATAATIRPAPRRRLELLLEELLALPDPSGPPMGDLAGGWQLRRLRLGEQLRQLGRDIAAMPTVAWDAADRLRYDLDSQRDRLAMLTRTCGPEWSVYILLLRSMHATAELVVADAEGDRATPGWTKCFIATAACQPEDAYLILWLQEFRERALRSTVAGRAAIRLYEAVSPPIAWVIRRVHLARVIVRKVLVLPAAHLARAAIGGTTAATSRERERC